ncbi:MAG: hypothetical protein IPM57_10385 [Oligoflexia bacterium]|nr:hypothetical protein [Oligoflexia bacterium]
MKLVILSLLLANFAWASNEQKEEKALVEEPIVQLKLGSYDMNAFFASRDWETNCQAIQSKVSEYYLTYKNALTAKCNSVRPELSIANGSYSTSTKFKTSFLWIIPGPTLDIPTGSSSTSNAAVQIFCEPRSLNEKLAIQAYVGCEQSPKPECFSPEYTEAFKQVKNTRFINNIIEQCKAKVQ